MTGTHRTVVPHRAWWMLVLGSAAQTSGMAFVSAPAFLIPLLHSDRGMSLAEAGVLAGAPTLGMVITLIAWGALADRIGERWVIVSGLAMTALATTGAIFAPNTVTLGLCFLVGGMAAASSNAASGRVVVGWFPKERRGLAMGIRQMSSPLGTTVAAVTVPVLAAGGGIGVALLVPLLLNAAFAILCALWIADPPRRRPVSTGNGTSDSAIHTNPYRSSSFLVRIHVVSILLVVPQYALATFGLVWLVADLDWQPLAAGLLVGIAQFVGALGRIGAGILSDRVGSRVRPLTWIACAATIAMLLLAATDAAHWGAAAVVFVIATMISVADNGLAFTSVAEMAGPAWTGRALGAQNTGQFLAASLVAPAVGGLIGLVGYPITFAIVAAFPAAAIPLVPSAASEHDRL